jgi:L-ascorbate metabolism protein UlaG (beta-lactamase superfamily)
MDITYIGHACFKLKSTSATVITDPFGNGIGFNMPKVSGDIVTVSHQHDDHNNLKSVSGTAKRENPFIIEKPGEYEVGGVSVFGIPTFHDNNEGKDRGRNVIFEILIDGVTVVHLGDLGHTLSEHQIESLNGVDVLIGPVGGHFTLGPKQMVEVINQIEPSIFIPMHYKTDKHNPETFKDLKTLNDFITEIAVTPKKVEKLTVAKTALPDEMEVVVFE